MARRPRKKIRSLIIVERGFRGALESQYAHTPWMSQIVRRMGGHTSLVLSGNCVVYAVKDQMDLSWRYGCSELTTLANYEKAILTLVDEGVPVYVNAQDCRARGISSERTLAGVEPIDTAALANLCREHEKIWFW